MRHFVLCQEHGWVNSTSGTSDCDADIAEDMAVNHLKKNHPNGYDGEVIVTREVF